MEMVISHYLITNLYDWHCNEWICLKIEVYFLFLTFFLEESLLFQFSIYFQCSLCRGISLCG